MTSFGRFLYKCRLFPLFYNEICYLVEDYGSKSRKIFEALVCVSFLAFSIRCTLFGFCLWAEWTEWLHWDPILLSANRDKPLHYRIYLCLAMFMLFMAYINYRIHFTPVDTIVWQLIYDLIVRNCKHFKQNERMKYNTVHTNRDLSLDFDLARTNAIQHGTPYRYIKSIVRNFWIGDARFFTKLPHFPRISIQIRTRVLLQHFIIEIIYSVCFILYREYLYFSLKSSFLFRFSVIVSIFVLVFYLKISLSKHSWFGIILIELDIVHLLILLMLALKICFFVANTSSVIFLVYISHLNELNRCLSTTLYQLKQCRRLQSRLIKAMLVFHEEHNRIVHYILYSNHKFWSDILFAFVVSQIPINVYFNEYLFFRPNDLQESILLIEFITVLQIVSVLVSLYPMAHLSNCVHRFSGYLPTMQQYLKCPRMRIQNLAHFESLVGAKRVAFSVGPLGQLTTRNMFEVSQLQASFVNYSTFPLPPVHICLLCPAFLWTSI